MDQSLQEFWMHFTRTGSTDDILSFVLREAEILQERGYRIDTQLFKSQLTSEDKYILNKSRFSYRAILGMVRRLTNGGQLRGDPDEITRFIFLTTRGTLYDWCMHEGQYDLCDMFRKAVGIVLSFYFGSRQYLGALLEPGKHPRTCRIRKQNREQACEHPNGASLTVPARQ